MKCYGCCQCQKEHMEDDHLYLPHIMSQSKHGIYEVTIETAIMAALVGFEMREREKTEQK